MRIISSGETHGSPLSVLAMPWRYLITWSESRVTELVDSDCAPSRMMRTFKGCPVADREV